MIEKVGVGNLKAQKEFLGFFLSRMRRNENSAHEFNEKTVCIDIGFQREYFNEFLALLEKLYSVGATYMAKASECNVFIQTHEEEDKRFENANRAMQEGRKIEFLTLEQTLDKLSMDRKCLSKKNYIKTFPLKKNVCSYRESKPTTLGDLLKSKGVILEEII